jgi:hypothetical protein
MRQAAEARRLVAALPAGDKTRPVRPAQVGPMPDLLVPDRLLRSFLAAEATARRFANSRLSLRRESSPFQRSVFVPVFSALIRSLVVDAPHRRK